MYFAGVFACGLTEETKMKLLFPYQLCGQISFFVPFCVHEYLLHKSYAMIYASVAEFYLHLWLLKFSGKVGLNLCN